MNEIFESDDLSKIVRDRNFVNCNQNWESEDLQKQGYSLDAIKYCCKKDLGNNPREKFKKCLENFEKGQK